MLDMSQWYIRLGNLAFNLVLLNILWVVFSLSGLIFAGVFPATAAMFAVLKQMIMENEDSAIIQSFWKHYKSSFIMSNVIGYMMMFVGGILLLDVRILRIMDGGFLQLTLASATIIICVIYLLSLLYIFPIFTHFDMKLLQYPFHAVILAVAKPFHTIFLLVLIAAVIMAYLIVPVLIIIFGLSLVIYSITKVATYSFPKKERAPQEESYS